MFIFRLSILAVLAILLLLMVAGCTAGIPGQRRKEHGSFGGPTAPGSGPPAADAASLSSSSSSLAGKPFTRKYRYHSRCVSEGKNGTPDSAFVQFNPLDGLDAKGAFDNPYSEINLHSVSTDGVVQIEFVQTKQYLCFSPKGKLITKEKKKANAWCNFFHYAYTDEHDVHYHQFYSAYNRTRSHKRHRVSLKTHLGVDKSGWMVGFNAAGRPINGQQPRSPKNQKCFDFLQRQESEQVKTPELGLSSSLFRKYVNRKEQETKKKKKPSSGEKVTKRTKPTPRVNVDLGSRTHSETKVELPERDWPKSLHPSPSKLRKRSHSAFVLLDEGGWKEVSVEEDDDRFDDDEQVQQIPLE